jgi:PGF-pre-PGF domain-containing protein
MEKRLALLLFFFLLVLLIIPANASDAIVVERTIHASLISPGDSFNVTITLTANQELAALAFNENLPEGWQLESINDDGAVFKPISNEWIWPSTMIAGEEKEVTYEVKLQPDAIAGPYCIWGVPSAYGATGDAVESIINVSGDAPLSVVANFSSEFDKYSGKTHFSGSSDNVTMWEWDIDNDGIIEYQYQNPVHIYSDQGTYNVTLTVWNGAGSDSITKAVVVNETISNTVFSDSSSYPDVFYVDKNGEYDFKTIQDAVNVSESGDRIYVHNGTYDTFSVNKTIGIYANYMGCFDEKNIIPDYKVVVDCGGDNINLSPSVNEFSLMGIKILNSSNGISTSPSVSFPQLFIAFCSFEKLSSLKGIELNSDRSFFVLDNISYSKGNGLTLYEEASDNEFVMCNFTENAGAGVCLSENCTDNNFIANSFISNEIGFEIDNCGANNSVFLNNFIDNAISVSGSMESINSSIIWNSSQPVEYAYKGNTYKNCLGNYWDDYNGTDANGDGIGDQPYVLPGNLGVDAYPLMERFENYGIFSFANSCSSSLLVKDEPIEEDAGATYSEATGISLSAKVLPAISIEVTPDAMDFGKLSAGDSSDIYKLKIFNKGCSKAYISSEVMDVAKDLYVEGLKLGGASWGEFSKTISKEESAETSVQLQVPDDYIGIGSMEGILVFWAETKGNNAPVLEHIGDKSVNSSEILQIVLSASDPDDDELTYSKTAQFGNLNDNVFKWNTTGIEAGVYEVRFSVSDSYSTDSETILITVNNVSNNNGYPIVDFTSNVTSGKIPLTVMFTGNSMNATSLKWDFGDGNSSANKNAVHTYNVPGNYTVSLTASNSFGNSIEKKVDYISAYPRIIIFFVSPSTSSVTDTAGDSRTFTVNTDEVANISWILDDVLLHTNLSVTNASYYCQSATAGTHNLTVFAENSNGTAQKEWIWEVNAESSSDSSSSSSSGARVNGGGNSGENYENILYKTAKSQTVLGKKITTYAFDSAGNPIVSISFIALKNSGVVSSSVEVLNGISSLVQGPPPGEVYKYMNIWVGDTGFATPDNIKNAIVYFKVEKSWLSNNDIKGSLISLYRYNDNEWNKLETRKVKEDDNFVYFEAETPGFSPFAIIGVRQNQPLQTDENLLYSTSDEEGSLYTQSNDTGYVPVVASQSGISIWIWIVLLLLLLLGLGIYIGFKRDLIPIKDKKYENVIFKDVLSDEAVANSPVSYYFDNVENPIQYIHFTIKEYSGNVDVKVEVLRKRSLLVKSDPPGNIYRHLNLWISVDELIDPSMITNSFIGFRVDRSWLEENGVDVSSVVLFRYADDMWHELPTEMNEENEDYYILEAQTPGFSSFAIVVLEYLQ